MTTIRVSLGERSYPITVSKGALNPEPGSSTSLFNQHITGKLAVIVTNPTIAPLYLDKVKASLEPEYQVHAITVPDGEQHKSFASFEAVLTQLLEINAARDTTIFALGGGVIGDLTGFVAASYQRGVPFIQIPTTLLSQVDSSVGGKTAVNANLGKNLIGQFYQPKLVLADMSVLGTLPDRQKRAGYAEIIKYTLIDRPDFFDWLVTNGARVLALDSDAIAHAVAVSCQAKADIVAQDEREGGVRALLNLGHTFGHALEAANGFGPELLHGEAVGTGMALAYRYSARIGLCAAEEAEQAIDALAKAGFATDIDQLPGGPYRPSDLVRYMQQDKKARNGRVPLILARGIGRAFIHPDSDLDDVQRFLEAKTQAA